MKLSCPSKTFCIGEYSVLKHHKAIVILTQPRFELIVHQQDTVWPPYLNQLQHLWPQGWGWSFNDPHHGQGGFGASSAQFLMIHKALQLITNQPKSNLELLEFYRKLSTSLTPPSGADVLAQDSGSISLVNTLEATSIRYDWPFSDIGFIIARTGLKKATHHELNQTFHDSFDKLNHLVSKASNDIQKKSSIHFIESINEYHQGLILLGLCHPNTQNILNSLTDPGILAKKGCGAMGQDTFLIITQIKNHNQIKDNLSKTYTIIGDQSTLSDDITIGGWK